MCSEQGSVLQAEQLYQRVLDAEPDNVEALHFLGARSLEGGQSGRAVEFLARAARIEHSNPELLKNLGLAYLACNRFDEARYMFDHALEAAPSFFVARLYLALALERMGHEREAAGSYYAAIWQAQDKGRWLSDETTAPPLRPLVKRATALVNDHRRRLFEATLAPLRERHGVEALRRVDQCLDIYLGDASANYPNPLQKPKFLYFPELPTTPYFAPELFDWYGDLERNTAVIREELLAVLSEEKGIEPFLKFGSPDDVPKFLGAGPQGAPAWDAFFFYRHGARYDDNCARCPRTSAILEALPLVRIRAHAPEVCFSVLAPGTHILPHHGVTNTRVVTHLPLIVPDACAIRVGGEEHAWQEGRCVTFDDTFEHEAWNRSEQTRVVLIVDTWNPHMTVAESEAVTELVEAIGDFNRECGVNMPD